MLENEMIKKNKAVQIISLICILVLLFSSCGSPSTEEKPLDNTAPHVSDGNDLGKIEVSSVLDKRYDEAAAILKQAGFTNISAKASGDVTENPDRWIVLEQSIKPGTKASPNDSIVLTCKRVCSLYLEAKSEYNLLFSKYDMEIYVDNKECGTVKNGDTFAKLVEVIEGEHSLSFYKAGDHSIKATKTINVSSDITFTCELSHGNSSIDMKNIKTENNINKAEIEVIDVTGRVLSEARKMLQELGMSKITEPSEVWVRGNWLVTGQSIVPGAIVDSQTEIKLECISLDDYFNAEYAGKNVNEIQTLAKKAGFNLKFASSKSGAEIDDIISKLSETDKQLWIAERARQYGGADKTAYVFLIEPTNITEQTEQPANNTEQTEQPANNTEQTEQPANNTEQTEQPANNDDIPKPDDGKGDNNQETEPPAKAAVPVMKGTSLSAIESALKQRGITKTTAQDFGHGTIMNSYENSDGTFMVDILYLVETKEILVGAILTIAPTTQKQQIELIKGMVGLLCPSDSVNAVTKWVNSNIGKEKITEIDGFSYEVGLGPVGNIWFQAGEYTWEEWDRSLSNN